MPQNPETNKRKMVAICCVPGATAPAQIAIVQADWPSARHWLGSLSAKQRRLEGAFRVRLRSLESIKYEHRVVHARGQC